MLIVQAARKLDGEVKSEQSRVIKEIVAGKDVFVALPTGYGKSLCYALLPIVFDFVRGRPPIVLCVSPLISLMVDQKEQYSKRGLAVVDIKKLLSRFVAQPCGTHLRSRSTAVDTTWQLSLEYKTLRSLQLGRLLPHKTQLLVAISCSWFLYTWVLHAHDNVIVATLAPPSTFQCS